MRRWPYRSPILPMIGVTTAKASIGAAITQVMMSSVVPRSRAMRGSEAVSTVTG